jgi:hypothetical protein
MTVASNYVATHALFYGSELNAYFIGQTTKINWTTTKAFTKKVGFLMSYQTTESCLTYTYPTNMISTPMV